jgi:Putative DNA-binding domain
MKLLALQRSLKAHILQDAPGADPVFTAGGIAGLAVYHNAYRAQLIACLRDTYEKTWAWLGDEQFDGAARDYVLATPPSNWTLDAYGETFPAFLQDRFREDPEVGELARLDWALRRAFDGEDATPLDPETLEALDWERSTLLLAPTLTLHPVTTNAAAIWGALAEETVPPGVEPLPQPASLRVWRAGLSPQYRTIEPLEAAAIGRVVAGEPFGAVCEVVSEGLDEEAATLAIGSMLSLWIQDQLIVGAEVGTA